MKKNDWALIISVFLYSILFYKQTAGINFLLFNTALLVLLIHINTRLLKSKIWVSLALSSLVSSYFIYVYGSSLAIVTNLFSLFILSALSMNVRTSFLTALFLSICSVGSSFVRMFIDWIKRKSVPITENYNRPIYVKVFLFIIPLLIAIVFFLFYQNANPLFYDFTKDINLNFISIGWTFFTYSGLLLLYGFFHNGILPFIVEKDQNILLELSPEIASRNNFFSELMRTDTENISGIVLFAMLNLLLLLVNTLDLNYLWFDGNLPKGINHKAFVHDGIGTLITSIILAIVILLFYFRGELNYYKQNKWLIILAYAWIAQNAFMIFSTAYRNNMYIQESGLSYKKIGVYVYLILTLIGLTTTFIKVFKLKTNWYLFRVNAAVYFYILILSCTFNWDTIITDFNIKQHDVEHKKLEKYLLLDLSFKNLPQLLSLPDSLASKDDFEARDYYNSLRGTEYYKFKSGLSLKLYNFLEEYLKMDWPSTNKERERVYKELENEKGNIRELKFENHTLASLKPLEIFNKLTKLEIENSTIFNLSELKFFPKLEVLKLRNSQLNTLKKLPSLYNLKELDLSENKLYTIEFISKCSNIEKLDLTNAGEIESYTPLFSLKKLKYLRIGATNKVDLEILKHSFPNVKIEATEIITAADYSNKL